MSGQEVPPSPKRPKTRRKKANISAQSDNEAATFSPSPASTSTALAVEGPDQSENESESGAEEQNQRPDPLFKRLMSEEARAAKLNSLPTELLIQQVSSPDLLLAIPPATPLENTLFDFFRPYNILEFKSYNDRLNLAKLENQLARLLWWASRNPKVELEQILNIIVSAVYPRSVIEYCRTRGCDFQAVPGRRWLYVANCGLQEVAIVVCEQLPLEPRYASWLIFAEPSTNKWHETLLMLARQKNIDLLTAAWNISPKEYQKMSIQLNEIMAEYGPQEQARLKAEWAEVIKNEWPTLDPAERTKLLAVLSVQERLAGLAPEERAIGLSPEQKLALLKQLQQELGESE